MIRLSHLIPLFRSDRFLDSIAHNVQELARPDSEIILADRNGDHAFCSRLRERFASLPNVQVICDTSNLTWVGNMSDLMARASGKTFQIIPHDDVTSRDAVDKLYAALMDRPDAVLAYGYSEGYTLEWERIPHTQQPRGAIESMGPSPWRLSDALELMWVDRFNGAFKGVIRSQVLQHPALQFQSTKSTILSERAWLFALALTGGFVFEPVLMFKKRFYPESTHRSWNMTPEVFKDLEEVMIDYAEAIFAHDPDRREDVIRDIMLNAASRRRSIQTGRGIELVHHKLYDAYAKGRLNAAISWCDISNACA